MKVLYLTNIPSPYRINFFNELGKYCDLTVLFERAGSDERDASWREFSFSNFKGVVLKGFKIGVDKALCYGVTRYLKKGSFDCIICTDFLTPTGMLAINYMRRHGISYYLESDGGIANPIVGIKDKIKTHFIKDAVGYFSTSEEHDRYYEAYGAAKDRIIRYPFSSVWDEQVLKKPVTVEEKATLRNRLGVKEQQVVLTVGQFIHRKGFDVLIKVAKEIKSAGFYFVGGEPTEEYLSLKEQLQLNNIHFVGFKKPDELNEYYRAADIFVLPTREDIWGLVINEAMANGLPVVTTTACLAGTEMVIDGLNGYLVEPEVVQGLADKITMLLSDPILREQMSVNALSAAKQYTIETMVEKHISELRRV